MQNSRMITRRKLRSTHLGFESLESRYVLDSTVVFNEIMYHPAGDETQLEWVELYNQMAIDMDLSRWELSGGVDYTFAEGTILGGGEYLVIATSPSGLEAATGFSQAVGPFAGRLSNSGEQLQLVNPDGRVMDAVDYSDEGMWPVEADGSGSSLHKIAPMTASGPAANWSYSPAVGGSPGVDNSQGSLQQLLPIRLDSSWRYHDQGVDLGTAWRSAAYNDNSWSEGQGLFYDEEDTLQAEKNTPLDAGHSTYYFRKSFTFSGDPEDVTELKLNATVDDGAVFYLNGTEVQRINMPGGTVSYSTSALTVVGNATSTGSISIPAGSLVSGTNVLAVEVHQALPSATSAVAYYRFEEASGISVTDSVSGQVEGQLAGGVRTADVPSGVVLQTGEPNQRSVDLTGAYAHMTERPFLFHSPAAGGLVGSATLEWFMKVPEPAGHSAIFWSNSGDQDENRFNIFWGAEWTGVPNGDRTVSGDYRNNEPHSDIGNHSNGNPVSLDEWHHFAIVRVDDTPANTTDANFTWQWYIDGVWSPNHTRTTSSTLPDAPQWLIAGRQGSGGSYALDVLIDEVRFSQGALSASQFLNAIGGQSTDEEDLVFGASLTIEANSYRPLVAINEMLPAGEGFQVELVNYGAVPIDLDGYVLVSTTGVGSADNVLSSGSLAPGGYVTFDADALGVTPEAGDKIFLATPGKGMILDGEIVDAVTRGRLQAGTGRWLYPEVSTPGSANSIVLEEQIVINEIMYHHQVVPDSDSGLATDSQEEWIELYNRGSSAVDLGGWQFVDAIDFTFPAGSTLAAGQYLVVSNNVLELSSRFPAANILGNFTRSLSSSDDSIRLLDARGNPADEVHYFDDKPWPKYADGGGSTLELRDPDADNSVAEAWAASDETQQSTWQTYTYRGVAGPGDSGGVDYHELVLGMLDEGEVLLDDISVTLDPGGLNRQLIQNGTFQAGTSSKWRIIGNHHGEVVTDPDDPGNRVLHVTATGRTDDIHNHLETTLKSGNSYVEVTPGQEYEISYRARWLGGSSLLNSRLYYYEVQKTHRLDAPQLNGTPGAVNSRREVNVGPTYTDLVHGPVVPDAGQPVTVSVAAQDPDGIGQMQLRWRTDGGSWQVVSMTSSSEDQYHATIPGQSSGRIVHFYVSGTDSLGASSHYPAAGADSRALYVVEDGQAQLGTLHNIRVIMLSGEISTLDTGTNLMSNDLLAATVIVNEAEPYYDVGVRRSGAASSRQGTHGFRVKFHADQLYRGVHESITADRNHNDELFSRQLINLAGGIPSMFNDLAYFIAPTSSRTGRAILRMAGFGDVFFESQYEDGGDGTAFEKESHYRQSLSGGVESLKVPYGYTHPVELNTDIADFGSDKEAYRWHWLIKDNRDVDDYRSIVKLNQAFSLSGTALETAAREIVDVDQWMRALAVIRLFGTRDIYSQPKSTGASDSWRHNFWVYERPSDGRLIFMPSDIDESYQVSATDAAVLGTGNVVKLIERPNNLHHYWGHVDDLISTTYNNSVMAHWVEHFGDLGVEVSFAQSYINNRASYLRSRMPVAVGFQLNTELSETILIDEGAPARVHVPSRSSIIDTVWTGGAEAVFNVFNGDASWKSGVTGIGYERPGSGVNYSSLLNLDVSEMDGTHDTVYVRVPFEIASQSFLDSLQNLKLKLRLDDGAVVYLNGRRVADFNAPTTLLWNSKATGSTADPVAVVPREIDLTGFIGELRVGENILAIHGLNYSPGAPSSDLLILPELVATTLSSVQTEDIVVDDDVYTVTGLGWVNVREIRVVGRPEPLEVTWTSATSWTADVPLLPGENVLEFEAYDFQGNPVAAPGEVSLTVTSTSGQQPYQEFLQISELMYHPANPVPSEDPFGTMDDDDFEFIEFYNSSTTQTLDLNGVRLTDGPSEEFAFSGSDVTSLGPGEFVLVVRDKSAFTSRYGSQLSSRIAGEYSGKFNNAGQQVVVVDPAGFDIHRFTYSDDLPWPIEADGAGRSLVLVSPESNPDHALQTSWTASRSGNGSPGAAEPISDLPGDYNGDGSVDAADYTVYRDTLASTVDLRADGNGSGSIEVGDYQVWKANFGLTAAAVSAVVLQEHAPVGQARALVFAGLDQAPTPPVVGSPSASLFGRTAETHDLGADSRQLLLTALDAALGNLWPSHSKTPDTGPDDNSDKRSAAFSEAQQLEGRCDHAVCEQVFALL